MQDQEAALLHAFVLDGQGGARSIERDELDGLQLAERESLWLHWDRSQPQAQRWLREQSGLDEFSCDLLLEENTRPRLLPLPDDELLLFLRGINHNKQIKLFEINDEGIDIRGELHGYQGLLIGQAANFDN